MLGKRARPAWEARRPEPIVVATRDGQRAAEALERSPRGWRKRESAGVGLGIVAALEKWGSGGDVAAKAVMGSPMMGASPPPLSSLRTAARGGGVSWEGCCGGATGGGGREKNSCRGVFCGVDEEDDGWGVSWEESGSLCSSSSLHRAAVDQEFLVFPTADFLSSCYLCQKQLHGEDIYMYRGEKAFCSMECRYRQIVIDEYQENCASQVSKLPSDTPISDYSGGRLYHAGVAAA